LPGLLYNYSACPHGPQMHAMLAEIPLGN